MLAGTFIDLDLTGVLVSLAINGRSLPEPDWGLAARTSVHLALSPPAVPAEDVQDLEEVDTHAKQTLVADVMAVDPIVVHVDASIEEADVIIRSTYLKCIPVVDGDGALVGVIRDADLVAYRFARSQPPGRNDCAKRGPRMMPARPAPGP